MKIISFIDLDNTFVQSFRKLPADEEYYPIAVDRDGKTNAYITEKQKTMLDFLFSAGDVVAATARTSEALSRVDIPFRGYKIVSHGALVLYNDTVDGDWLLDKKTTLVKTQDELNKIFNDIDQFIKKNNFNLQYNKIVKDHGYGVFIIAKNEDSAESKAVYDALARSKLIPPEYFLHYNDREIAVLPANYGKKQAVEWVRRKVEKKHGAILVLGIGDSLSDSPYLNACDFGIFPKKSQINDLLEEQSNKQFFTHL